MTSDLMAEKVQDHTAEDFEEAKHQRGKIQDDLAGIKQVLEKIRTAQRYERGTKSFPEGEATTTTRTTPQKEYTVHTISQASPTFRVTNDMLHMDETTTQTPLKYLAQVDMVLARIPTKALYRLQVSVAQEVQSRARTDTVELQEMKGDKEALELVIEQVKFETRGEKEHTDKIKQGVTTVYNHLPDNAQAESSSTEEKLNMISQTIDHYRKQIEELKEKLTLTTPPEVREQRKAEVALQLAELEKQANTTT
jgi:hypothetical protein